MKYQLKNQVKINHLYFTNINNKANLLIENDCDDKVLDHINLFPVGREVISVCKRTFNNKLYTLI
jgi:hypothetical protein